MYTRMITAGVMLFSVNLCALSCSTPVTISDAHFDINNYTLQSCVNEKGDAVVTWLSASQKKEAVTISYKKQNTPWSSPEIISKEENFVFWSDCSIRENGDLSAGWKGGSLHVQLREKREGEPWTDIVEWEDSSFAPFHDLKFDSFGQLVAIGLNKKIAEASTFGSLWSEYPRAAIFKQSEDYQPKQEDCTSDKSATTMVPLLMQTTANRTGYACWMRKTPSPALIAQKIQNYRFVSEAEMVCKLQNGLVTHRANMEINKEEDCVISYVEEKEKNGMIVTRYQNNWSEPFLFAKQDEGFFPIQLSLDKEGNIMSVCTIGIKDGWQLKTAYKHFGRPWQTLSLIEVPNIDPWSPRIKSDGNGNFVLIWKEEAHRRGEIHGATFSKVKREWSKQERLSPQDASCGNCSFEFWNPGKGHIFWESTTNGFDICIQAAELFSE